MYALLTTKYSNMCWQFEIVNLSGKKSLRENLCARNMCGKYLYREISMQEISVWGNICSGKYLCGGISVWGNISALIYLCRYISLYLSREIYVQGKLCSWKYLCEEILVQRNIHAGNIRAEKYPCGEISVPEKTSQLCKTAHW